MTPTIDPKTFRNNPFLDGLSNRHRDAILRGGIVNRYAIGDTVFHEGDIGEAMYLVLSGKIEIQANNAGGLQEVLGRLASGELFGEGSLMTRETRSVAVRDSYLIAFSRQSVETIIESHPRAAAHFLFKLLAKVSSRLRDTTARLSRR